MLTESKRLNSKTTVRKVLSRSSTECSLADVQKEITRLANKYNISEKDIKFKSDLIDSDEYGHDEYGISFYVDKLESDEEFEKRKNEAAVHDVNRFLQALATVEATKKEIKRFRKAFDKANAYLKGNIVPPWQQEQVAKFFAENP